MKNQNMMKNIMKKKMKNIMKKKMKNMMKKKKQTLEDIIDKIKEMLTHLYNGIDKILLYKNNYYIINHQINNYQID